MVHLQRLLNPAVNQNVIGFFHADMANAAVDAFVTHWYSEVAHTVDMIAPKYPHCSRAWPSLWFIEELRVMEQQQRRLESRWRKDPTEFNLAAVREASERYCNNLKVTKRRHDI